MENKIYEAFDSIKAQPRMVESTKQFLSEQRRKGTRLAGRRAVQRPLAAFCCMLFVLAAGMGGYSWLQTPVSYVGIDVNPSIELGLNRFDRVVTMNAYNEQGAEIIDSLPLKGKKYTDAISLIVDSREMDAYLTEESEIIFTVAADGRGDELMAGAKSCASHAGHRCQSVSADLAVVSQAHGHGVSLGKYYAYLLLAQYDDTVTIDGCSDMSVSEMHSLIEEHEHGTCGEQEHGQDAEQGYLNDSSADDSGTGTHHSGHHQEGGHE